jgi:Mg/Co/Ni transporter MgtE
MDQPIAMMTVFVSFLLMTFLQAMALMFRFGSEISTRRTDYRILRYNGCTSHDCRKIMKQEVAMVYGAVLLTALFYISNVLISYTIHGSLHLTMTLLMILTVLLALLFGSFLNQIMYRRLIQDSLMIQKNN